MQWNGEMCIWKLLCAILGENYDGLGICLYHFERTPYFSGNSLACYKYVTTVKRLLYCSFVYFSTNILSGFRKLLILYISLCIVLNGCQFSMGVIRGDVGHLFYISSNGILMSCTIVIYLNEIIKGVSSWKARKIWVFFLNL